MSRSAKTKTASCILLVLLLASTTFSCKNTRLGRRSRIPTEGLVAHYPFNGNANDQTANEFHGVVHNATLTADRRGKRERAYSFDGINDHIRVKHDQALNLHEYTISLWADISRSQEAHGGINDIIRKWHGDHQGYPFAIAYLNSSAATETRQQLYFARYDGHVCRNVAEARIPFDSHDTFVHIAVTRSGDNVRVYLNNELVSVVTDGTHCGSENNADLTIGSRGNPVRYFKGKIDDIRIYDRALTESEIESLYRE